MSQSIKDDLLMGSNLIEGSEYREILTSISDVISEVLVRTLGPYACTTTIDDGIYTYATKDGHHTIENLRFGNNPLYMSLFNNFRNISFAINNKVGDGTTTVNVSANIFLNLLIDFMEKHKAFRKENPNDLVAGIIRQADLISCIKDCKDEIIAAIKTSTNVHKIIKTSTGYDDVYKIAYVASNRDDSISSMIKKIYDTTDNPNILVTTAGTNNETVVEFSKGFKLNAKLLLRECYMNNLEDQTCEINDKIKVMIFDHNVKYNEHPDMINALYTRTNAEMAYLVVMAPYFDEAFMNIYATKIRAFAKQGQMASLILVQIPMVTTSAKNEISDFAVLVNAQLIDYGKVQMFNEMSKKEREPSYKSEILKACEDSGYKDKFEIIQSCYGELQHIILNDKFVHIDNFDTTSQSYLTRKSLIETEYNHYKTEYDKSRNVAQEGYKEANLRFIKFLANSGIIRVGGESDVEKRFLKDVIDDAVLACKSAYENGYIRGLNIETISTTMILTRDAANKYQRNVMEAEIKFKEDGKLSHEFLNDVLNSYIKLHCFQIIMDTFFNVSLLVMRNKHIDDSADYNWSMDLTPSAKVIVDHIIANNPEEKWPEEFDSCSGDSILALACQFGLGYDIVTEKFEAPGENVINSVLTDCEILNAITTMLSLLLSSNQCISTVQMFDKKTTRESILKTYKENAKATASGYAEAFNDAGCTLFVNNALKLYSNTSSSALLDSTDDDCEDCNYDDDVEALRALEDEAWNALSNEEHEDAQEEVHADSQPKDFDPDVDGRI